MTTWRRRRTTVDSITGQLQGIETAATITAIEGHVVQCSDPANMAVLPGAVTDAASRTVKLTLDAWLGSAALGSWDLTWHPTFGDGSTPIWPEDSPPDQIIVLA